MPPSPPYLGRLAPSPTGYLHLGHARTFWTAAVRARRAGGELLLRIDDLDHDRCREEYVEAIQEDLAWLGLPWRPPLVSQSKRQPRYREVLQQLHARGLIFPCERSRRDVEEAAGAPHQDEPVYPAQFRPRPGAPLPELGDTVGINWRFRVPDGRLVQFNDERLGPQAATAGIDFGDFLVWRKDDTPSYQLACAVDDADMGITEVVRGMDLIKSTFRQLLVIEAMGRPLPRYFHAPLVTDGSGQRLAKRSDAQSLRALRASGVSAESICRPWAQAPSLTA